MASATDPATTAASKDRRPYAVAAFLLCAGAAAFPLIALPAAFLLLLAALAQRSPSRPLKAMLVVGAALALGGLVRFTVDEAAPGIIEGGRRAQAKAALNQLRQIVFAEDVAREQAFHDPDGDGVGSALALAGLLGGPVRGGRPLEVPLLLRMGPLLEGKDAAGRTVTLSTVDGYAIALYLPARDGSGTPYDDPSIDDEAAERRFAAYAWPLTPGPEDDDAVFYVDEREHILVSDNRGERQRYFGAARAPAFDAALSDGRLVAPPVVAGQTGRDGGVWLPWKGKQPRARLVGDR